MSQQINLILPELKPRFDWLAMPLVGAAALAGLALVTLLAVLAGWQAGRLQQQDAELKAQMQTLQRHVVTLGQALAERKPDPALQEQVEAARQALAEHQEVLAAVGRQNDAPAGFSGLLQGFSRQTLNGAWLTGFTFAGQDVEIRGRLADAALLPAYIDKLNGEPAFAGRRFAALDMKAVDPAKVAPDAAANGQPKKAALPPYVEFALKSERVPQEAAR